MKRKKKTPPGSARVTALMICAVVFVTWAAAMFFATAVAKGFARLRFDGAADDRAQSLMETYIAPWAERAQGDDSELYMHVLFWNAMTGANHSADLLAGDFPGMADSTPVYTAAAVYDAAGRLVDCSWRDFITFENLTEAQLVTGGESSSFVQAFIDSSCLTEEGRELMWHDIIVGALALRFTGGFDGGKFIPSLIEFFDYGDYRSQIGDETEPDLAKIFSSGGVEWSVMYSDPDALPEGDEVSTLYARSASVSRYEPSPGFSFDGVKYADLAEFVSERGPELSEGCEPMLDYLSSGELNVSVSYSFVAGGESAYSPYIYSENISSGEVEVEYYLVSASYFRPWLSAVSELRYIYLVTFLLAAVLALAAIRLIRRRLIMPARYVGDALLHGGRPDWWDGADWYWLEAEQLREGWAKCSDETKRLSTALEYARTAEQDRRQMTSNIAHELKTPLAVIHSYAEGLREHIAEEKRDKYLDVILSEAERADAMVLEMLDLSRLEAGKVKLTRSEFSLAELARSVFARFDMAAEAKGLEVVFDFPEALTVTADEGRIAQVIENYAANAVKYTPEGGHIRVSARRIPSGTRFAVENDSPPLSAEALEKVWESFYRADESRSGGGTGLGLAIAKSIIELHGGTCEVRNTQTGVEFGFVI